MINAKNRVLFFIYFTLSTMLTWWFIVVSPLYISLEQMLWSCGIAGGKWMLQLIAAFVFLKDKKWDFMRRIGFVCLVGSLILVPFCFAASFHLANQTNFFVGSLIVAILVMIFLYYRAVRQINIHLFWWIGWLICLTIAISLQLTVVFNVL